jgi:hypothetical protein
MKSLKLPMSKPSAIYTGTISGTYCISSALNF